MIYNDPEELIPLSKVIEEIDCGKSSIYRMIKNGKFPRPVKLGTKSVRWKRSQLERWKNSLREA
jgi:prophage regulatory protein